MGLRAAGRLVVIPLGHPAARRRRRDAAGGRDRVRAARRSSSRSARSSPARTSRTSSARSASSRRVSPISASSSPVTTARPGPRSTRRSRDCPAGVRDRVVLAGGVTDAGRRALLEQRDPARVPVDLRRLRVPGARSDDGGRSRRRGARGIDSRGRGRCGAPRRTDERSTRWPTRWTASSPTMRSAPSSSAAAATASTPSRGTTPHAPSRRAIAGSRSPPHSEGCRPRRPAAATGARRHRPLRDRPAPPPPRPRRRAHRLRRRCSPTRRRAAGCRGSTSDRPRRQRALRALASTPTARGCASRPTSCTRPSLAVPPVGDRPLVVTVHDVAFLRLPHVTTKRGVSFHTRGLTLARRHADARDRPVGVHRTRARARRVRTRPHRRRSVRRRSAGTARSRRDRSRSRARRRATSVRAHGRHRRTAQGRRHDRARGRPTPPHAPGPHAGRRGSARMGRGTRSRSTVRTRHRRAAVVGPRRALPPRRRVLSRVALRGFRAPRRRGDGARRADDRRRPVPRSKRSCRARAACSRPATPTRARNRSPRARRRRPCAPNSSRAGLARAADLSWDTQRRGSP